MTYLQRNLLSILALVFSLFVLGYVFIFSKSRVAYVDSGKLLGGYKAMVEARKEFEKKQSVWQTNVDSLTKDVTDAIKKYENTAKGTDKEKELAKELVTTKQRQLYEYQNAIKQKAADEEQRLTQNVLTTVNSYLERYGKKHNYRMILIAANGNIAYADADMDITDKIVDDLNKEYAIPVK
jgi:outer membrane protein